MDKMVSESHLILLLSLIQVSIKHLKNSIFGIDLTIVILLINLNIFFELLSLSKTKHLSPMSKDLHSVKLMHLLLLKTIFFKSLPTLFENITLLLNFS